MQPLITITLSKKMKKDKFPVIGDSVRRKWVQ